MGVARYLREHKPGVRIVAAEPLPGEQVQGLRSLDEGFIPEILDPSLLDAKYLVSNRDAIAALRELVVPRGDLRRPVVRGGARGGGPRGAARCVAGRSSRCFPTAAGSTSPRARSRPRLRRDGATSSRAASTGGDGRAIRAPSPPGCRPAIVQALIDHARAGYPNEACGLVIGDRPAADGGRALRFEPTAQRGRLAVPLRDRARRPVPADRRDRRRRRGLLGDRPFPHAFPGRALADRHRARRSTRTRCTCSCR